MILLSALLLLGIGIPPVSGEPGRTGYITLDYYPAGLSRSGGLIVAAVDGGSVAMVDPRSGDVVATYDVGPQPEEAIADRSFIYVLHQNGRHGLVSLISRSDGKEIRTAEVQRGPTGLALEPSQDLLYVTNFASRSVSVLDSRSLRRVGVVGGPRWEDRWGYPTDVAADPVLERAYVATTRGFVIELDAGKVVRARKIASKYASPSLTIEPGLERIYVTSDKDRALFVLRTGTLRVVQELDLGRLQPDRVSINTKREFAAVLGIVERGGGWDVRLRYLDLRSGRSMGESSVGYGGWDVETVPGSWTVLVSDALGNGLEIHSIDGKAPQSRIIDPEEDVCSPCRYIKGASTDDLSGVKEVFVTFSMGTDVRLERRAELVCDNPRDCRWKAGGPQEAGVYTVKVSARDRAGNVEQEGPSMEVVWVP